MITAAKSQGYSQYTELSSNLAAMVCQPVQADKQLVVLDVGLATAGTVDWFSQFKSKLVFLDLYSESFISEISDNLSHDELVAQFKQALGLDLDTVIDVCLFWDFFNYLDIALLKAFAEALEPHIASHTRGYGLGVLNARSQLPNASYGLLGADKLSQCLRSGEQKPIFSYSQRDLDSLLKCFEIDKSRLMSDGRVEYIMARRSDARRVKKAIF